MKAFVGIYQEREQADRYLDSIGMEPEAVMEVGPFVSQFQAVEWLEFMTTRIPDCKSARCGNETSSQRLWYGFTAGA